MRSDITHIDLHFPVQSIIEEEVVCHADPVWFHGMPLAVVVVPHIPLERKDDPDKFTIQNLPREDNYMPNSIQKCSLRFDNFIK